MRRTVLALVLCTGMLASCAAEPPAQTSASERDVSQAATTAPSTPAAAREGAVSPTPTLPGVPEGMVIIPGGTFQMGDTNRLGSDDHNHKNDEVPVHSVTLDTFAIGRTETTSADYVQFLNAALDSGDIRIAGGLVVDSATGELLCDTRDSDAASPFAWNGSAFAILDGSEDHPATGIRWCGAAAYCNWLGRTLGYDACYDPLTWQCDLSLSGFRLPTEAEWEYAALGGQSGPYPVYPWGDRVDLSRANLPDSGDPYETGLQPLTTPVGFYDGSLRLKSDFNWPGLVETYQTSDGRNGYGLFDMAGNAWEWANDWYAVDYYEHSPSDNPPGPEGGTLMPDGMAYHVLRGGNWYNGADGHSRVSNRNCGYYRGPDDPNHSWYHVGFRIALELTPGAVTAATSPNTDQTLGSLEDEPTVGLLYYDKRASEGYTLFAPKHYTRTYLIDNAGRIVNTWDSKYEPGQPVYLLENGHLLHCCMIKDKSFIGGGEGGRIEEYDWEGNLVWEFELHDEFNQMHHDIAPLPNGNILATVVEKKSREECIAAGFDPDQLRDQWLFPDYVIEIARTGPASGEIIWQWHVWDHLIQDRDPSRGNYGEVAAHPELIAAGSTDNRGIPAFWNHMNSIDYNPERDEIMLSVRGNSELWVIDHSTTTEEAAGHSGGTGGRGGDLLYRWGNPQMYEAGSSRDQMLFQQHDTQWIASGLPGEGNILVFNNGLGRNYSSVDELVPPLDNAGEYHLEAGQAYGPRELAWTYTAPVPSDLYSEAISGAQRLPNGNTLICDGVHGVFTEVTTGGEIVWRYVDPVVKEGPLAQGETPGLDDRGHQWNAVFNIHRYPPDYPAFEGRDMIPGATVEE